jgi:septum site-determining protein MinD
MGRIISVHSYRGGTGKSNITANLAWLLARRGRRVAVLDTDLQSPGVHLVLGLEKDRITETLTDFLFGKCEMEDVAYDMTATAEVLTPGGALFLLPSSMRVESITRILAEGYDVGRLESHLRKLMTGLSLDVLFIDTHPGLNKETMLTTTLSDSLVLLIRPDSQDFHGTAVVLEVAKRLGVPHIAMVANKVSSRLDPASVVEKIKAAFGYEVLGVLPLDEEVAALGSRGLFAARHPAHPVTAELARIAERLDPGPASAPPA